MAGQLGEGRQWYVSVLSTWKWGGLKVTPSPFPSWGVAQLWWGGCGREREACLPSLSHLPYCDRVAGEGKGEAFSDASCLYLPFPKYPTLVGLLGKGETYNNASSLYQSGGAGKGGHLAMPLVSTFSSWGVLLWWGDWRREGGEV